MSTIAFDEENPLTEQSQLLATQSARALDEASESNDRAKDADAEVATRRRSSLKKRKKRRSRSSTRRKREEVDWLDETIRIVEFFLPIFVVQAGFTIPNFVVASYIGRNLNGIQYLGGFTLAHGIANLLVLSFLHGFFNAAETLSQKALEIANDREVGILAVRGWVASLMIMLPVVLALSIWMEPILVEGFHQNEDAAFQASVWFQTFLWSLPLYAFYIAIWKFLSPQKVVLPLVLATILSCAFVLPRGLNWLVPMFGFAGSATAIILFQSSMCFFVLVYCWLWEPYRPATLDGLFDWHQALAWRPFNGYVRLSLGAVFASSEWIFWELFSLMVGSTGPTALAAHTIASQVMIVSQGIALALGMGLASRLAELRSRNRRRTVAIRVSMVTSALFAFVSLIMYELKFHIFSIFTAIPEVLEVCNEIWGWVCLWFFLLSLLGVNWGVAAGLGLLRDLGSVTAFALWVVGLPLATWAAIVHDGGIVAAWAWLSPAYIFVNLTFFVLVARKASDEGTKRKYRKAAVSAVRTSRKEMNEKVAALLANRSADDVLDDAIKASDCDFIFAVLMHLEKPYLGKAKTRREYVKAQASFSKAMASALAPEAFNTLRRFYDSSTIKGSNDLLKDLLVNAKCWTEAGMVVVQEALLSGNSQTKRTLLHEASRIFRRDVSKGFNKSFTDEYLELMQDQEAIRFKYGKAQVVPPTSSVAKTISGILMYAGTHSQHRKRLFMDVERLARKYSLSDKRLWHIKIDAFAASGQWRELRFLADSKDDPPTGYAPFCRVAIRYKQSEKEVLHYIGRIRAPRERYEFYAQLKMWRRALEEAVRLRDLRRIREVMDRCQNREIYHQGARALSTLTASTGPDVVYRA